MHGLTNLKILTDVSGKPIDPILRVQESKKIHFSLH